jgi:hypothetical protein
MSSASTIAEVELPVDTTPSTQVEDLTRYGRVRDDVPSEVPSRRPTAESRTHLRPTTPASFPITRQCEICGEMRGRGEFLVASPRKPPVWACADCQQMLLLGVDDHGTAGD